MEIVALKRKKNIGNVTILANRTKKTRRGSLMKQAFRYCRSPLLSTL
ncbi:MAG: hypothetical protein ACLUSP_03370 [Christensenellales bacterium]